MMAGTTDAEACEQTPLIQKHDEEADEAFAWLRMLSLCLARSLETLIFFSVIPILPALVERAGVAHQDLGFWVGLVEAIFSVTQFVFTLVWGSFADAYGRRRTLLIALLGVSMSTLLFGLATQLWQMILARAVAGVFSACTSSVRVMLGDTSNHEHAVRGFAYAAVAGQAASFFSPLITGLLFEPAVHHPWVARKLPMLSHYPALLGTCANALVGMTAFIGVYYFVHENHAAKQDDVPEEAKQSLSQLFRSREIRRAIALQIYAWMVDNSLAAASATFFYSDVRLGGWGWSTVAISRYMAVMGSLGAVVSAFVVPQVMRKYGDRHVIARGADITIITPLWFIVSNELLRHRQNWEFWTILPAMTVLAATSSSSTLVAVQIAVNNMIPKHSLGRVIGILYALGALQRAITPTVSNSLLAVTFRYQLLNGHLNWLLLAIFAAGYALFARAGKHAAPTP